MSTKLDRLARAARTRTELLGRGASARTLDQYALLLGHGAHRAAMDQLATESRPGADLSALPCHQAVGRRSAGWAALYPAPDLVRGAQTLGSSLIAWGAQGTAWLVDAGAETVRQLDLGFPGEVGGALLLDSGRLVVWSTDRQVGLYDRSGECVRHWELEASDAVHSVQAVGADLLAVLTYDGDLVVAEADGDAVVRHSGFLPVGATWMSGLPVVPLPNGLMGVAVWGGVVSYEPLSGADRGSFCDMDGECLGLAYGFGTVVAWTESLLVLVNLEGKELGRWPLGATISNAAAVGAEAALAWGSSGTWLCAAGAAAVPLPLPIQNAPLLLDDGGVVWRGTRLLRWHVDGTTEQVDLGAKVLGALRWADRIVATTSKGNQVLGADLEVQGVLNGPGAPLLAGTASEGRFLGASPDGTVRGWDLDNVGPPTRLGAGPVRGVQPGPKEGWLSWGADGVRLWSPTLEVVEHYREAEAVDGVALDSGDTWVWSLSGVVAQLRECELVECWNLGAGAEVASFLDTGLLVAASRAHHDSRVWVLPAAQPGDPARLVGHHQHPVRGVTRFGELAVTFADRGEALAWDPVSGDLVFALSGHRGTLLGAGSWGGHLVLWSDKRVTIHGMGPKAQWKLDPSAPIADIRVGSDEQSLLVRTTQSVIIWDPRLGTRQTIRGPAQDACLLGHQLWTWHPRTGLLGWEPSSQSPFFEAPLATGPVVGTQDLMAWPEPFRLQLRAGERPESWWHDLPVVPHFVTGPRTVLASDAGGNLLGVSLG